MAFYSPPGTKSLPTSSSPASSTVQSDLDVLAQGLKKLQQDYLDKLEKVTGLSKDKAKEELFLQLEKYYSDDVARVIEKYREHLELEKDNLAKEMLVTSMLHGATDYTAEYSVSIVTLPNDGIKGSIIGREGKNIAAFEKAAGVEIEIDEGNTIRLSSFDSLRREIAKRSLEFLIKDARITPTRIEEVVSHTKQQMETVLVDEGRKICNACGVFNLHPDLVKMIGKFRFRFSYGQNLGIHTIEETKIGVQIAHELKMSEVEVNFVRLGCLLHDIGKVVTDEDGTHVQLGVQLLKKYDMPDKVLNAVAEHHEDKAFSDHVSRVVWIADAISGSRPGARYEPHETYVKRISQIEEVVRSFAEVSDVYAFQAGRDVRILVRPEMISDSEMTVLVSKIRQKLEKESQYVGQIKVTAIREVRATDITKAK